MREPVTVTSSTVRFPSAAAPALGPDSWACAAWPRPKNDNAIAHVALLRTPLKRCDPTEPDCAAAARRAAATAWRTSIILGPLPAEKSGLRRLTVIYIKLFFSFETARAV